MSVTPDFVGQRYKDTNTGNIWIANSTTPGDWTLEVQNYNLKWEPKSVNLGASLGINIARATEGGALTSIVANYTHTDVGFYINNNPNVLSLSAPILQTIGDVPTTAGTLTITLPNIQTISLPLVTSIGAGIGIIDCTALTLLDLDSFQESGDAITITGNSLLSDIRLSSLETGLWDVLIKGSAATTLDLGLLETVGNDIEISGHTALASLDISSLTSYATLTVRGNALLTSISVTSLVLINGTTIDFSQNALNATTVNAILARGVANAGFVSGNLIMNGGTNSAPTGQGIVDKATLSGRGVGVSTN